MKKMFLLLILVLTIISILGCGGKKSDMELTAPMLYDDYMKSGEQAGNAKYIGKTITVSGSVEAVNQYTDGSGYYVVLSANSNHKGDVICDFTKLEDVKGIKEKDLIKIQGVCVGQNKLKFEYGILYDVKLTNSKIVEK